MIVLGLVVVLLGWIALMVYLRRRRTAWLEASIARFPMGVGLQNVTLLFWKETRLQPIPREIKWVQQIFAAAREAWPEFRERLEEVSYRIWFVRDLDQPVAWKRQGDVPWGDLLEDLFDVIDDKVLVDHGKQAETMYVATFAPEQAPVHSPLYLLAHALTHAVPPLRNHTSEFVMFERRIKEAIK